MRSYPFHFIYSVFFRRSEIWQLIIVLKYHKRAQYTTNQLRNEADTKGKWICAKRKDKYENTFTNAIKNHYYWFPYVAKHIPHSPHAASIGVHVFLFDFRLFDTLIKLFILCILFSVSALILTMYIVYTCVLLWFSKNWLVSFFHLYFTVLNIQNWVQSIIWPTIDFSVARAMIEKSSSHT